MSEVQCGHFTASIAISDLQYGHFLVVGAFSSSFFLGILLIILININTENAMSKKLMIA